MNNDNMFWNGGSWVTKEKEERPQRAKIIDAHYHIFPKLGAQKEGIDLALRTRFWQYHSREFNNWWRVDTGEKVDQQFLEFKSNNMADMPNVNFRLIDYGKARITIDKIDYDMQFYTPNLINNELPPERGIGEMNLAGVDIGILQADHVYGDLANFYGKAMRDYPDRFIGLAQIWEPEANNEVRLAKLERSIVEQCNKGLYFSVEPLAVMEKDVSLTDPMFDPLKRKARADALEQANEALLSGAPIVKYLTKLSTPSPGNPNAFIRQAERSNLNCCNLGRIFPVLSSLSMVL